MGLFIILGATSNTRLVGLPIILMALFMIIYDIKYVKNHN